MALTRSQFLFKLKLLQTCKEKLLVYEAHFASVSFGAVIPLLLPTQKLNKNQRTKLNRLVSVCCHNLCKVRSCEEHCFLAESAIFLHYAVYALVLFRAAQTYFAMKSYAMCVKIFSN